MATTLSQSYDHTTVKLKIEGEASTAAAASEDLSSISGSLTLRLEIHQPETVHLIQGDPVLLSDLVRVLDRYLSYQLQAQPQGTFNGSVAIRPLDFLFHRLTVRQGEGIVQVDLSMTQLYDLLESLAAAKQALPQLETLQTQSQRPPSPAWYAQPPAIAALLIAGVGVVAAATVFTSRTQEAEQVASSTNTVETQRSGSEVGDEPPDPARLLREDPEETAPASPSVEQESNRELDPDPSPSEEVASSEARQAPEATDLFESSTPQEPSGVEAEDPLGQSEAQTPAAFRADDTETAAESSLGSEPSAPLETTTRRRVLSEAGASLASRLEEDWTAPADLEESLSYGVIVDEQGSLLAVDPQNDLSADQQDLTPFADIESTSEADLPSETEAFLVILSADQVLVEPQ